LSHLPELLARKHTGGRTRTRTSDPLIKSWLTVPPDQHGFSMFRVRSYTNVSVGYGPAEKQDQRTVREPPRHLRSLARLPHPGGNRREGGCGQATVARTSEQSMQTEPSGKAAASHATDFEVPISCPPPAVVQAHRTLDTIEGSRQFRRMAGFGRVSVEVTPLRGGERFAHSYRARIGFEATLRARFNGVPGRMARPAMCHSGIAVWSWASKRAGREVSCIPLCSVLGALAVTRDPRGE
jgi:hypothetical protein